MAISREAFTWIIQKTVPFFGLRLPGCWRMRVSVRLRWLCWLALCTNSEAWYSLIYCEAMCRIWKHLDASMGYGYLRLRWLHMIIHDLHISTCYRHATVPQHVGLTKAKMHATQRPKSWVLASPREATSTAATWRRKTQRNQTQSILCNTKIQTLLATWHYLTYLTFWTSFLVSMDAELVALHFRLSYPVETLFLVADLHLG